MASNDLRRHHIAQSSNAQAGGLEPPNSADPVGGFLYLSNLDCVLGEERAAKRMTEGCRDLSPLLIQPRPHSRVCQTGEGTKRPLFNEIYCGLEQAVIVACFSLVTPAIVRCAFFWPACHENEGRQTCEEVLDVLRFHQHHSFVPRYSAHLNGQLQLAFQNSPDPRNLGVGDL